MFLVGSRLVQKFTNLLDTFSSYVGKAGQFLRVKSTEDGIEPVSQASIYPTTLKDADADTKVDTEESTDEDIVRFDTGGTERMALNGNGLQILVASPGTPQANTIVKDNIVKGWIKFSGEGTISINDSFNVSSIADTGTGSYTVNWNTDFANVNYACVVADTWYGLCIASSYAVGSIHIGTYGSNFAGLDLSDISVIAIGDQ